MKVKVNENTRRNTIRVLKAFSCAMLELLRKKSLEEITVGEICERSTYPRSTFYNYFEDIFDLMNYCWSLIAAEIKISDYKHMSCQQQTMEMFTRFYDYVASMEDFISPILKHNSPQGAMLDSLKKYINGVIKEIMNDSNEIDHMSIYPVPFDMIVEHYSSTMAMLLEWCFFRQTKMTKEEALRSLDYLIGTLERRL